MISEQASISLLQSAIADSLGPTYRVNTNALTSSLSVELEDVDTLLYGLPEMDLVIWGPDRKKPFIIEFKALRKGVNVPLATVPLLIRLVERNPAFQPYLIFATTGTVGSLVRRELVDNGVEIVEGNNVSDISTKISKFIQKNTKKN